VRDVEKGVTVKKVSGTFSISIRERPFRVPEKVPDTFFAPGGAANFSLNRGPPEIKVVSSLR
jgi:hypothetical protein